MNTTFLVIVGVVVLFLGYLWITYNSLVTLRERISEALSSIDVQLKRRAELIPNLVSTVKGYAKQEKEVFTQVTKARSALQKAKSPQQKAQANNMLTDALKTLFAVAEAYPDLKSSSNFMQLQEQLTDTENKISYSRQFYNSNVLSYNTKIKQFPVVLVASSLGFDEKEFFETEPEKRDVPEVAF